MNMTILHPTYSLRVELQDTNLTARKFADPMTGKTGCDEVLAAVKKALDGIGIPVTVRLEKFDHRSHL
jgi:hypothetical protein